MAGGGHVIGKSVFVIDVPAKSHADRCFAAISRAFQEILPEYLPSFFDELQTGDIHLRIDRLVIDLGTLTEAELSNNLTEILLVALKEQLKKYLSSGGVYPYLTERANIEYFLRYYFSKGRYPWWANEFMAARSPVEWLHEYVEGNETEGEILIKAILRDPVSQKRLSLQKDLYQLNLPEMSLDIWNPPRPSDYAVSHHSGDEWLWYFLELGRFPTGMVPVSVQEVIALLLQVAREKPENSLSRMREITLRRPWSLSRLTQLADTEVLQKLVGLWSGTPLEEIKKILSEWGESQFSQKEIWKEVLYWLASEPESVHGKMPAFMHSLTARQAAELTVDFSEGQPDFMGDVWYFIEHGRFPDGISRISMPGLLTELEVEFHTAPLLSVSRLREIIHRRPWALSRLVRLADEKLLCLIASSLTGIPETELNKYVSFWRVEDALVKELWTEILERILTEYSPGTVRERNLLSAALSTDSAALQPTEISSLVNPDEAAWVYLETGVYLKTDVTGIKAAYRAYFLKYAERQPLLFLARLREIGNISSGAVSRLIHLYSKKQLFRLISVLSGTAKRNIEAWLKGFDGSDPESLLSKEQIGEILEWLMIQPSSQSEKLREILSATVPGVSRESMKSADNRESSTEDQVWYYLESGALLPGSGIQTGIRSGDLILRMASRKPVYVLSRLQEMINRNPVVFIRMLGNYKTEVLVRLIRLLAGTRLQALDDIGTKDELLLNGILESAFRWLWNSKISERKNLEDALQDIIGGHIPEKVAGQPPGLSAEDLVWYYLEYGLIPESATGVSVAYLLEVFLKLASGYPALVLARLGEILGRKPWVLFRLSMQCTPEYLSRLVEALSGMKGALFDISDRMLHPEMTPQDVWVGFLRWLVDNQFADKERAPGQYLDFISIQEGSESPSMDELVWYYLRYWRLPGRLDGRVVHETELFDRLLDMFDFAPFHTRARMRELASLNTGFLTNLITRLSDRQRTDLVSRLSGLTTDELSEITLPVSAAGALRLPVREFWRGVLQWLVFEKLPDDRFRVYLNELVNTLKKPVKTAVVSAEASLWNYIESGNLYDFTPDRLQLLLQLAAAYPEQTLFRLAYLTSVRPVLLSSLILRLDETDLLTLISVLTGTHPASLEVYKNSFQTREIPVRPVLEEILRWFLASFSGDKKRPDQILHEILTREQPGDSNPEYTLENMFWYLLEHGSLPEKSGVVTSYSTVEAHLLTISVRTPLLVLSRLKDISRRSTDNFIRFFVRQNSEYLIQTISALSGIELRELNVFPVTVSGMTWPESLLKLFWFRALRWLVDKPLTQRSGILDFLQNELDFLLPPVEQQEILPAPRFSADENTWFFLLTGNSPEGAPHPAADEINRIVNRELHETPARLFSKITEFQRADRHFASRFTEKLSLATLHDTAIVLFGCTKESLREIQKTLLSDTSLKRTWVEALRWIVSDFIVRAATGGSRGPLAIKGPGLSDYTLLWFFLEFGRFPVHQKLSGKKSPGVLIRKALEDNFLETRNQLREIYQSRTGLVSDINSIFTENDLLLLVTGLLQISVAVWKTGVSAGSGEQRYRLSWALRLILAGVADQSDQIMALTRLSGYVYKPDMTAENYHDPEDQLWYFLEFGITRERTNRVERSEMAGLLTSALAQRRNEVSGRLMKLAQVNRALPLLLSTMFSLQRFWDFLGVWFNSDPDDWQKKWPEKDYQPEYSLQIATNLLSGRYSHLDDILRWIEEQRASVYGLPAGVSSIWYYLESGYQPEKTFRLSGRDAVEILISSAAPEDLLLQLRRLYHRNSSALLRLLQLTDQSGGDMLVLYLSGANYSQRKELDVLFDAYGRDDSTVNHIMNLALKLLVTRGFQSKKTLTEWVYAEIGIEKRTTDTTGDKPVLAIANQIWKHLEAGQFRGDIPEPTEQEVYQYFLDGFFRHKDEMVARLRELFRTRPGLIVRLVSLLDTEGQRMAVAAILGLDLTAWKVLEDHLVSELRVTPETLLLTGFRYLLKSESTSGEELLSGIFHESGLLSGERAEQRKQPVELFWYYLEFGYYPAGEKSLATKQGNLILEQAINSPDGEFIRRLTAVFKKDSTMLLRLSVISSSELRRRLLLAIMKMDNGTLKQLEKKMWSESSGKISREEVITELLRLALSREVLVADELIAISATESGVPASSLSGKSVPDRNQAYLLWYYLEQGRYPPGEVALKENEAAGLLMNQLSEDADGVIIRLRELFRYHPALLVHLSGILNISLMRRLVARIIDIEENVWMIHEDIIRSGTVTPHNPFRFQTAALSYVLSGSAENLESLVALMSAQSGLGEPEVTYITEQYTAEYTIWYFLEYGYYPSESKPVGSEQVFTILRELAGRQAERVVERFRQIYRRNPEILLRMSRIFDSAKLKELLSAILKLNSDDWERAGYQYDIAVSAGFDDDKSLIQFVLKWWLAGEINNEKSLIRILQELVPVQGPYPNAVTDGVETGKSLIWLYLEQGHLPAGNAALTEAELASIIQAAILHDREDTLYRLRDLYRRSPTPVLLIGRMGASVVKSMVAGLLNISVDELNTVLKLFPDGENLKDSVTESLLTSVLRMILIGEIKNQSDLKSYASPKTTKKADNLADVSPLYQLWYYLDQGKRLVGSVPRDTMITVLLESASANRTVTLRQLTDLYSQSKGVFIRLLGLLTPENLNKLVLALLNLDDESWYNTGLSLQDKFPDLPDQNRLLTDLLRGLLGGKLNDKSKITDFLQQLPEYSSDNVPSLTPLYAPESLIWFFLDSGRYPPGVAPMSDEELRSMLLRIVARRPAESLNRLRELYNRRQSLLLTFSRLFKENDLRTLIAGLMHLTDTQWNRMEDELRASTRHSSERLLSGVLRYLLTSNSDSHEDMLQSLASPVNLLPDIVPSKMSEEDYLWYFLEHGRLFDQFSPEIPQLAEKLTSLWRISPERISVYWRTISARTNLYNRLLQHYSQPVLEQIVRARYENIPVDLDLMASDLLTFTARRKKKITTDELWKFIIGLLLPQLDEVRNAYFVFEALIGELAGYYGVSPEKIAIFLKDYPQVSQAGQRYALRTSGSATREELGLLTEALENRKPGANRTASDNPFLTLLDTELRTVQELLSGAIWWTDLPDAAGTISWLLRVGKQPALRMIEKMLENEWVVIRLSADMPLEIVELIQGALTGNLWHELLSVRDEALYYFDLLLHERLIRHFNEAFFRIAANKSSHLSSEKVMRLFLDRIILHEHVTVADLVGAVKGKNTVGQGVLYRYVRKKYGTATTAKPLLEMVREASTRVDEVIYITNAGLVILHPYLLRYFDMLGLMEGKEFRDAESAMRAVHLLQYLATRQTETPEHLLVLNKILCGLPIDMPVPPGIDITDREREVSESLLKGVLQNWKKMENSSIDNLSGAFLVREGRLLERADRWTLHVKSRAYDILLEFLPWGFSGIKLSWMPKRMEVKWKSKA